MRIAHLLRKYDASEWGGTETAVQQLLQGLKARGVDSVVFCPRLDAERAGHDPIASTGCEVRRFHAFVPVWGLSESQRRQLVAVGGNIFSWQAIFELSRVDRVSLIHTHCLMRLGGIARRVARWRGVPLVVTVHGGVLALPDATRQALLAPLKGGVEWGKLVGVLLGSRRVLNSADAIITLNPQEARLLREAYPNRRIEFIPHGVKIGTFERDQREAALEQFPSIRGKRLLLAVGRLEPVKNQSFLIEQAPHIVQRYPETVIALVGPAVHPEYAAGLRKRVAELGLEKHVIFAGGLPPATPELVGLMQQAEALLLPSLSETFGLVLLEAWCSGTPVIASRTPGARELVVHGRNGWMFDLAQPQEFHRAVTAILDNPREARAMAQHGKEMVARRYNAEAMAGRTQTLYQELVDAKGRVAR
jgi:glycosyltransferase involved in cell wall biosynthesis